MGRKIACIILTWYRGIQDAGRTEQENSRITTLDLQKVLSLFKIQDQKYLPLFEDLLRDSLKQ